MKVVCIQPQLMQDREKGYSEIRSIFKTVFKSHENCDIACLPERWIPFFKDLNKNFQLERGEDYSFVQELAKEFQINIISGAIWEKRKDMKKPFITSYFFNQKGEEIGRQDKIHLYATEKRMFEPGKLLNLFKLNNYYFSILICFDMAFYETPRLAAENGADVLFSPTQIRADGMKNWAIYLQARALENRIPVVACNTFGKILDRNFQGNSKIISFVKGFNSPSKLKVVEGPKNSSGFIYDDLDLNFPKKIRKTRLKEKINTKTINIKKF
ncbi:MAG: carbon-nitrogen hydrolase family protein [Promethearchaeota archaeon]